MELADTQINFVMLNTYPHILGKERKDVVDYGTDVTHYYNLDPTRRQSTNIFFQENTINLKDNIWDLFDVTEYDVTIYE